VALLTQYDPPAYLSDFRKIPGQLEAWHKAVSFWFDYCIKNTSSKRINNRKFYYYNAANTDPGGIVVDQEITWNAFPKQRLREYGRNRALEVSDQLWNIDLSGIPKVYEPANYVSSSPLFYRPQEEYCEWHVNRDEASGKILKVTFTSEPPEYWQALSGRVPVDDKTPDVLFPGSRKVLLKLYRDLVDPHVKWDDLIAPKDLKDGMGNVIVKKGAYNIYNKWNTAQGIAHLNSPPNSLIAEIQLGADASVRYVGNDKRLFVEPEALIVNANYGGANRNSDPTIGATVNALARLGFFITLKNPVGLYMDHIDLSGWGTPDGKGVEDCIKIVRGSPGMIERLVVEVPKKRGFTVGDIMIAGEPVRYGGQIAECITVKLVGRANITPKPQLSPASIGQNKSAVDPYFPNEVIDASPGAVPAFVDEGLAQSSAPIKAFKAKRTPAPKKKKHPCRRRKESFS
jgi:hypothetical protein